jgi:hypothetical protein
VKLHPCFIAFDLVRLAAGQLKDQRVAFVFSAEVDFGRRARASRGATGREYVILRQLDRTDSVLPAS